jgi:hypothetical protein
MNFEIIRVECKWNFALFAIKFDFNSAYLASSTSTIVRLGDFPALPSTRGRNVDSAFIDSAGSAAMISFHEPEGGDGGLESESDSFVKNCNPSGTRRRSMGSLN